MPRSARVSTGDPDSISSNSITTVCIGGNTRSTEVPFSSLNSRTSGLPSMRSSPSWSMPEVIRQVPGAMFQPVMLAACGVLLVLKPITLKRSRRGSGSRIATCSAPSSCSKRQLTVCPGQDWLRLSAIPPSRARCRNSLGASTRSDHQWPSVFMYSRWALAWMPSACSASRYFLSPVCCQATRLGKPVVPLSAAATSARPQSSWRPSTPITFSPRLPRLAGPLRSAR